MKRWMNELLLFLLLFRFTNSVEGTLLELLAPEDGTDRLIRNFGTQLPTYAA
jgi:hypothetical protein